MAVLRRLVSLSRRSSRESRCQSKSARWWLLVAFSPPTLVLVPVLLSFIAWVAPWSDAVHRGFETPERLTARSIAVLASWYGSILLASIVGVMLGRRLPPRRLHDDFPWAVYYRYFTVLGLAGVLYAYGSVFVADPDLVLDSIRNRTFNEVRLSLGYGTGVHTLRYATILGGGVALYRILLRGHVARIDVLNVVLLLAAAAIASRLSFLMAVLMAIGLHAHRHGKLPMVRLGALAATTFVLLVVFNYMRNATYYERVWGVENPLLMNVYEFVAYLGGPFQASVGVSNRVAKDAPLGSGSAGEMGNAVPNGGAEAGTFGWRSTRSREVVSRVERTQARTSVESGSWALAVVGRNESNRRRTAGIWTSERFPLGVAPGDVLALRAFVSGAAVRARRLVLGVRLPGGAFSEAERVAGGIAGIRPGASRGVLSGTYVVPSGVDRVQVAVWQTGVHPRATFKFAIDGVEARRIQSGRSLVAWTVNSLTNPSAEVAVTGWRTVARPAAAKPFLSLTPRPAYVRLGQSALLVRGGNSASRPAAAYVFSAAVATGPVAPGSRHYLRAYVSGPASAEQPIQLGVRVDGGEFTQRSLEPLRNGFTKVNANDGWRMEALYTVPTDVSRFQIAIWKSQVLPRERFWFAVDDAVLGAAASADLDERPPLPRALGRYLLPTYLQGDVSDVSDSEESYRSYVNIESNLTTNSVLAHAYSALGGLAFPALVGVAFAAAILAGHASRYRSGFFLTMLVLGYCFAELWRVYIFNAGVVHFLLLALALVPPFHVYVGRPMAERIGSRLHRVPR